eukprot:TRINITY_DN91974_c0_g1_i1.p1 TRINITY_DN91974_c0_g1~~TRINITY_DN91974_c0_g1_i1.p1  ORF type:complete len:407 (+),score=61.70 TRINITY_DN91974_c0_g1_i1:105-1325(+)
MITQLRAILIWTVSIVASSFVEQLANDVPQKYPTMPGYDVYANLAFVGFQEFSNASTVQKVEQCAHLCNATQICVAFTFEEAEKYCKLKSGIGTWHKHEGVLTGIKEHQEGIIIEADEDAHQEETRISDELLAMEKLPPLHPGEDCLEACGNQSGWCSWCGMAKACCASTSESPVCSGPPAGFVTFGHECVSPRRGQLNRLGLAHFSFRLEGFDYSVVLTFEWLREELINSVKAAVVKLLLHTARVQQVSLTIHKVPGGWAGVRGTVMIPEGGPAAGFLAATRLCFSAHSMSSNLEQLVLETPGINLGKRSEPDGVIKLENFELEPGRPCPHDVLMDFNSKSWIESCLNHTNPGFFLLLGALLGWLAACCFFGLCIRHCRESAIPRKPSNRKHIHTDSSSYNELLP